MGAQVTVAGPPTLIPRGIEALGCEVRYDLDDLREADVVYALRMQNERIDQPYVPSLREYATRYQINGRRLHPRQVLMHPGPVNRGVELSRRGRRLAAGGHHRAGRGRRRRPHGGPLRAARGPARARATRGAPAGAAARMSAPPLVHRQPPPADLLIRGAHVLDPRAGIDAPHDVLVRDGEIAEIGAPGALDGARRAPRSSTATGRHLFPAFVDPHVHLRTPGQEHKEDLETGTRAAAAGGFCAVVAMPNTDPVVDTAPILRALRDAAAREARIPVGFMPCDHARACRASS